MILIIGDLHLKELLGYADYIDDRREGEKKEILDHIVSVGKDCDKVVFLGDQLNNRNNPSSVIKDFVNFVERFNGKELFFLAGNHEKSGDGKSAIDFLREVKNDKWHVITDKVETFGDYVFCPYFSRVELDAKDDADATKKVMKMLEGGKVLFVHHAISDTLANGIKTNLFPEVVLPKSQLLKLFKLVVAGHIHTPQQEDGLVVAGSIFCNEVGDNFKDVWLLDEKTLKIKEWQLPGRGIIKLEDPTKTDLKNIYKSSIVKVVITKEISDENKKELLKSLERFDAYIYLEQIPHKRKKLKLKTDENILDMPIEKLLELYAKEKNIDILKLKKGFELIKK